MESMGHPETSNPLIVVHYTESYLSENRTFFAYIVQLAWAKKLKPLASKNEGCSLPYPLIEVREA